MQLGGKIQESPQSRFFRKMIHRKDDKGTGLYCFSRDLVFMGEGCLHLLMFTFIADGKLH